MENSLSPGIELWVGFNAVVLALLAFDLLVLHRHAHAISLREAALWSGIWVVLSLSFCAGIFVFGNSDAGLSFLTGYLIEYSLSVDNIFVIVFIFSYFAVPPAYQHRVLFWGILGALVMRGILIGTGSALLEEFHWLIYVFGAILLVSAYRMATQEEAGAKGGERIQHNPVVRLFRRLVPVTDVFHGQSFFIRQSGALVATPLVLVLLVVETTDLVFALDSVPAILAITKEPFLVYSSNVCAILGLRSLYFLLAGVSDKFHYLKIGLSLVLAWVGVKMLLSELYEVPILLSLGVIAAILSAAVGASLAFPKQEAGLRPVRREI